MTPLVTGLCLALAASTAPAVFVPAPTFTLAWTHSIERVRWEEDYAVEADGGAEPRLRSLRARIRGSAAGMEPPPDARWERGWFVYAPRDPEAEGLRLSRSAFVPDYELCLQGRCAPLNTWLPSDGEVTLLRPCRGPTTQATPPSPGAAG